MADRLVVLRDGVVQQFGTPEQVYDHPANGYVAGFMGYRNLLEVDATQLDQSSVVVEGPGIRLTGSNRENVAAGRAVAAIRPEDFVIGGVDGNEIDVTVQIAEYHGRELSVEALMAAGTKIYFRTQERVASGDKVTLGIPPHRVLVFKDPGAANKGVAA